MQIAHRQAAGGPGLPRSSSRHFAQAHGETPGESHGLPDRREADREPRRSAGMPQLKAVLGALGSATIRWSCRPSTAHGATPSPTPSCATPKACP